MSQGHCACECAEWGHDGSMCNGRAESSLPISQRVAAHAQKPCCRPCLDAIESVSSKGVITPPELPA